MLVWSKMNILKRGGKVKNFDKELCTPENFEKGQANMPDTARIETLSEVFKVFGDVTRLKILYALKNNELCVCDLSNILDMTQSSISHQLRTLRDAKLVKGEKKGRFVMYSLDDEHVHDIIETALEHILHT